MYEIRRDGDEFIVRDFVTDDSGGMYDVHEIRFYSLERAEEHIKTMKKVRHPSWQPD